MFRKIIVLIAAICSVLLCGGCEKRGGQDYSALEKSLIRADKSFAFDTESGFFDCAAYYFWYSFRSPDDVLLKLPVDEAHRLTGAAVSVRNTEIAAPKEEFMKMCAVIIGEFFEKDEVPEVIARTGLYKDESYFSEGAMLSFRGERYAAALITVPQTVTFTVLPVAQEEDGTEKG